MKFKKKSINNENIPKTRKELRKQKRQDKKQKKNEYFSNRKLNKLGKIESGGKIDKENDTGKRKTSGLKENAVKKNVDKVKNKVPEPVETAESMLDKQRQRERQIQNSIQANSKTARNKQLINANVDEDKEIKRLEKLLNMNKRKSKKIPSSFVSDGLDYLLELCDSAKRQEISEFESQNRLSDSESDFENDLAEVTGKTKSKKKKEKIKSGGKIKSKKTDENSDENSDDGEFDNMDEFGDSNSEELTESEGEYSDDDDDDDDDDDELVSESEEVFNESNESDDEVSRNNEELSEDENFSNDEAMDEDSDEDNEAIGSDNEDIVYKPFGSDDSVDEDYDDTDEDEFSEEETAQLIKENGKKRKTDVINKESGKRVKFADDVKDKAMSKEERMKALMGFVEKESKEESKKEGKANDKKLSKEQRMKALMGYVDKESNVDKEIVKDKKLSKEERMKALMGFVDKKSKEDKVGNQKKLSKEERMKQLLGFVNEEQEGEENDEEVEEEEDEKGDGTWEDIYGRLRDKDGNIVQAKSSAYVPPHLRATSTTAPSQALILLQRQLKGLLNRLTENNIKSISGGVEALYAGNSRHDTNTALLALLRGSLLSETLTPEKMMMEHALLVVILHANVGTEIGASLLQALVQEFDSHYKSSDCHQVNNKRLDNHLNFLVCLYQFKMVTHTLVYDLLQLLIDSFDEKAIELILSVLKTIGLSLRKENAVRFKSSLLSIQSQASALVTARGDSPRVKFMLEILLAVKNNNVHKIPGYDVTNVTRMRGSLKFLVRPSCYVQELNISLQDLLKADEKGRWWIVGSAWVGSADSKPSGPASTPSSSSSAGATNFSAAILELARKQRMNTDVRRNAFCVLMSSEDYLDAYERLLKLGVRNDQCGEVVGVIVHCLLNEKQYNPYYTHLTNHFIASNRRYRMLVQYCVWDRFKLLKDMKPTQVVNLAKFLSALFVQQALPLSILKVIEFTELQKYHVRLVRQIFLALLLLPDPEPLRIIFAKVSRGPELKLLREGLHLFLVTFVINKLKTEGSEGAMMKRNASLVMEMLAPR